MQTFTKADVGVMDFSIDYYAWLGTDTLSTSTWIADTGITIDSNSFTNTMATVILSGGTIG